MVIDLFVLITRGERDVLEHRFGGVEIGASRTERTCARNETQTRCDVFGGNNLFLAYLITVHVNQSMRGHVR